MFDISGLTQLSASRKSSAQQWAEARERRLLVLGNLLARRATGTARAGRIFETGGGTEHLNSTLTRHREKQLKRWTLKREEAA
jgi:hypothetical protein